MSELITLSGRTVWPSEPRPDPATAAVRFEGDADYFERRASEELAYAASLPDARCRALHTELASRHAQLAAALREANARTG